MRSLLRYVLPLLIAPPIAFLILYPQVVRCARIGQSDDFRMLTGTGTGGVVYVNRSATARQQVRFRGQVLTARDRIRRFWGDRRGQAVLIYCPQQADYERYCAGGGPTFGEGAGCSIGTPWGASYLILGPDGNDADVIAHELCHDEIFSRLGWWRVKQEIPQWFNEGLALMVDYRFSSPDAWEQPGDSTQASASVFGDEDDDIMPFTRRPMLKLADLETTRDFFGGDYGHVMLAYQTAADEVSRWLARADRPGVPALTDAIANGDDFGDAYRRLERAKRRVRGK